jgi:hypothetical protein
MAGMASSNPFTRMTQGEIKKVLPKESAAGQVSKVMSGDNEQSASGSRASYRSRSKFYRRGESGLLGAGYEPEEMK